MTIAIPPKGIDTPTMPEPHVRERIAFGVSGIPVLGTVIVLILAAGALIPVSVLTASAPVIVLASIVGMVAGRQRIVEGAVVLCGDREPQPVVNTGTLYQ